MAHPRHPRGHVGPPVVLALVGALLAVASFGPAPAARADPQPPPPPPSASDVAQRLEVAQHEAEVLTEQWHEAQDDLEARNVDAQRAAAAVGPARTAVERARADEERYRTELDPVVAEAYQAGNLDQLTVLITSTSPEDYLNQMTALDGVTSDRLTVLTRMVELVRTTTQARAEADAAAARARQAADQARAAYTEIGVRKKKAELRINETEKLLATLDPAARAARTRDEGAPTGIVLGGGKGALALKIAMTKMRRPYIWGATGPGSFDCSGLVFWAFKKVGITVPRSSSAQAKVGRPVAKGDLRPGDLIFFYHPVSHVGFYAGNGKVLNAVQTGDVVRYSELSRMMKNYNSARRL